MKYDVDIRRDLFANTMLSGGTTMLPNIDTRLSKELDCAGPVSIKYSVLHPVVAEHLPRDVDHEGGDRGVPGERVGHRAQEVLLILYDAQMSTGFSCKYCAIAAVWIVLGVVSARRRLLGVRCMIFVFYSVQQGIQPPLE